jgi:predicted enzyme related to lactoylglutathione lyase
MNESKNDRRIDYIEFRVRDIAEAKAFYGDVFGWRFKDYGPNYCEFQDGRLTGGFTTEGAPQPGGPLVVIYGDDLPALSQIIVKSGGRISKPTYDFPGGQRFHFVDPNGYELAVWTAKGRATIELALVSENLKKAKKILEEF